MLQLELYCVQHSLPICVIYYQLFLRYCYYPHLLAYYLIQTLKNWNKKLYMSEVFAIPVFL